MPLTNGSIYYRHLNPIYPFKRMEMRNGYNYIVTIHSYVKIITGAMGYYYCKQSITPGKHTELTNDITD